MIIPVSSVFLQQPLAILMDLLPHVRLLTLVYHQKEVVIFVMWLTVENVLQMLEQPVLLVTLDITKMQLLEDAILIATILTVLSVLRLQHVKLATLIMLQSMEFAKNVLTNQFVLPVRQIMLELVLHVLKDFLLIMEDVLGVLVSALPVLLLLTV